MIRAILLLSLSTLGAISCPETTPWSTPVALSSSGDITSNIFSAATSAGFMAVWADSSNNAHYSFSPDGTTWETGLITPAQGLVALPSDVFVAGNETGFIVSWMDSSSNNAWSSFSPDNGASWSDAIQVNPNTLTLDSNSDVYVSGSSGGFVATMIGTDSNAYVSFSTGTATWTAPTQVTFDGSVYNENWNSQTTRGFVGATVVENSCMLTWISNTFATFSAYFETINPFSSTTVYPLVSVGFFESVPVTAELNGYFMAVSRANQGPAGQTYFSTATLPSNWATFSAFTTNPANTETGPWVAANQAGFLSTWIVGASEADPGTPVWTLSNNNGFNWTPVCSILAADSTTITGPVGLSANRQGFAATWLDTNDSNAYASFYAPPLPPISLQGCKTQNRFLMQFDLINKLTWQTPSSASVTYNIYRDAELTDFVATVFGSGDLQYLDHNREPNEVYSYYIVSVDSSGAISAPASVTVAQAC